MKQLLLLCLMFTSLLASAQIVNIPDANFKAELIADGVDTNTDGEIQVSEALATINMDLDDQDITDITGLEAFVNLESFTSFETGITSLDLTNNVNLVNVEVLFVSPPSTIFTSIDLSNCIALEELILNGTSITTLDCSNNTNLTGLYIANNSNLETVYIKNGSDESANMDPGSWSENWAFGNNPNLTFVCADEFQVMEIQDFAGTDYVVNSFCSFDPGGDFNTITGETKFDDEGDGCDTGDFNVPYTSFNVNLNGNPTSGMAFGNSAGVYSLFVAEVGTYDVIPNLENPTFFTVTPNPASVNVLVIDNSTVIQDFCIEADGIHPDLEVVIAPIDPARPGFEATYGLVVKNKGNVTLSGDVTFNYDDDRTDFVSSSIPPDAQSTGQLVYNFTDLVPFQNESIEIILDVNSPTDTPPVNIDDVLVFFAEVAPLAGDENPNDNFFTLDQIVVGSFDPNNVICLQGLEVPTTYIGDYLHYIINFENTGTAPAERVVVTMEINSEDYDANSLQILNTSHDMETVISDNFVEFHFDDIDLDTGGHGNILLKLRTLNDLTLSDQVAAQANIYFDFNFPIETNEAVTSFRVLGVNEFDASNIAIYPNPAQTVVHIQGVETIETIAVYDVQGRSITSFDVNTEYREVDISNLTSGIYFFSITSEKGTVVKKLIKE
ncbi:MAG: T9SS type A sorting domain-containing protein [Marinirhabdus sp.]|nr:T9SS type A sorting domain-containing protein [Marinirhabdus sp.]